MAPLLLLTAGLVALGAAALILRSFGPGYRVGRLLAVAPRISVAEAVRLAEAGTPGFVRIDGRIDSDAEFEDADHQPLVLRRTTIAWRPSGDNGRWTTFDVNVEAVPFVIREGLDGIAVDTSTIGDGLITVPRERVGVAADLPQLIAAGIDPEAEVRMLVEQVSSVEHGTVLGVPSRTTDGGVTIGSGLGRPLILSTLEDDESMRALTGGATGRSRLAVACLAAGVVLIAGAALWWLVDAVVGGGVAIALAASPDPTLRPGGDTRTSGGGPGLVGDPLFALFGVLGIAAASLIATLAYVRLTRGGGRRDRFR